MSIAQYKELERMDEITDVVYNHRINKAKMNLNNRIEMGIKAV